jgi:protein subunit release factor B
MFQASPQSIDGARGEQACGYTPAMPLPAHLARLALDCDITAYRSSGPGGQKKNKTESSVRVKHLPSGITRIATESRSQGRNRQLALERVWAEIQRRARKPKRRVATRPSRQAVERRLTEKRQAGERKQARRTTAED